LRQPLYFFLFLVLFLFLLLRRLLPPNATLLSDGDPNLALLDPNWSVSDPNLALLDPNWSVSDPNLGVAGTCGPGPGAVAVACGALGACTGAGAGGCPGLGGGGAFCGTGGADENRFAKKSDAFSCQGLLLASSGDESNHPPPDFLRKLRCPLEVDLFACLVRIDCLLCLCIYYIKI
jgi:hypothetical protein